MLQKLRSSGFTADKETVHSFGPNHAWHIDRYDKLKPFGIAIYGAIDEYSRIILWLKLSSSNSNTKVIANYYLCCVKELNLISRVVRGDRGTENVIACGIQRFFRRNHSDSQSKDKLHLWSNNSKPTYRILVISVIQKHDVLVDYLF